MTRLVPNPLHAALEDALRTIEPLVQEVESGFETPFQAFHSGGVWTGPAAKRFDEQLVGHRTRLRGSADRILADLRQTLARTPRQVSEEEATAIRKRYGLP
ncbi:hypothetical protein ABZ470_30150 [Streptosporangium sp. NPDC020072]|uniref:WXG100 family type VII secretion target n=1 Tax=Streptosporangium jomthongense TaxID=1193683 RepID=A0ABV8F879_9ACTN